MPIFLEVKKGLKKIIMSKKILIYTEGKSDKNFLDWCLDVWKNEDHFDIIHVEGKDKLFSDEFCKRIENILKNKNQEYRQVCIIFDADIKKENQESDVRKNMLYAYLEVLGLEDLYTKKNIFDTEGKVKNKYKGYYEKLTEVIDFNSKSLVPLKNFLERFVENNQKTNPKIF